jgi:hypothetical protein
MAAPLPSTPEERRQARANCEVRIFRSGDESVARESDALYWERIPIDQRAEFVWQLSVELHRLAHPTEDHEPRLPRSATRVVRR